MRLLRAILIVINLMLLVAFQPLVSESLSTDGMRLTVYKANPVLMPVFNARPEQPALARPLFRARPLSPEPVNPEADAGSASSANLRLMGIVLTDEHRVAVLERDGATLRIAEGDDLDGWIVATIESRRIRLKNAERHVDIQLDPSADAR